MEDIGDVVVVVAEELVVRAHENAQDVVFVDGDRAFASDVEVMALVLRCPEVTILTNISSALRTSRPAMASSTRETFARRPKIT